MSEASRFDEAALPLAHMRRIDAACARFEKAWKAGMEGGQRPRIDDYLDDLQEPEHPCCCAS